ncbi:Nn.00g093060.m01.CDS01 [Neocucurbitaria sp. VM-36]
MADTEKMIEFDKGFRQKGENRLNSMWVVMSALGLWLNHKEHIMEVIRKPFSSSLVESPYMGCAVLTMMSAIDQAGELKPDSKFLDLTLVIGEFLAAVEGLPDYAIEGECVYRAKDAVALFKKGKLDPEKALFGTAATLKAIETSSNYGKGVSAGGDKDSEDASGKESDTSGKKRKRGAKSNAAENDPWQWKAKFKAYKDMQGKTLGGEKYDITKMSSAARKEASYDGKDPLAGVSAKDLKNNLLDFA